MSVKELEKFSKWFEEFAAEACDREFEADVKSGKLEDLGQKADLEFTTGRCKPLP